MILPRLLYMICLWTLISLCACQSTDERIQCSEGSFSQGLGPPLGKRVVCLRDISGVIQRHGMEVRWFAGGQLRSKQTFVNDTLSGRVETWFSNGNLSKRGEYLDDDRVGLWSEWSYAGHLRSESFYVRGQLDGSRKFYYPSGQVKSVHTYQLGVLDGPAEGFHPGGQPSYRGRYGDNVRQGPWIAFDSTGRVLDEVVFVDGRPQPPSAVRR